MDEGEIKFYFLDLLAAVKEKFGDSILFEERYAQREEYKALQWLFRRWLKN